MLYIVQCVGLRTDVRTVITSCYFVRCIILKESNYYKLLKPSAILIYMFCYLLFSSAELDKTLNETIVKSV